VKIQTYQEAKVTILRFTAAPNSLLKQACQLTQKKNIEINQPPRSSAKLIHFLLTANHGSVLEHVSWTFYLEGVSRSFLAQITRHRIGSFTSASQHYADYRDMPMVVSKKIARLATVKKSLDQAIEQYIYLVDQMDIPPEEARQVLPNAAAVNLIWTVNARALANFFEQRLCHRNVEEMQVIADKILDQVYETWFDYAACVGPTCYTQRKCNQGAMSCGEPYK